MLTKVSEQHFAEIAAQKLQEYYESPQTPRIKQAIRVCEAILREHNSKMFGGEQNYPNTNAIA